MREKFPLKAPLPNLAAREPEGRPCGGAFFSPRIEREQEKGLARHNERLDEVPTLEAGETALQAYPQAALNNR